MKDYTLTSKITDSCINNIEPIHHNIFDVVDDIKHHIHLYHTKYNKLKEVEHNIDMMVKEINILESKNKSTENAFKIKCISDAKHGLMIVKNGLQQEIKRLSNILNNKYSNYTTIKHEILGSHHIDNNINDVIANLINNPTNIIDKIKNAYIRNMNRVDGNKTITPPSTFNVETKIGEKPLVINPAKYALVVPQNIASSQAVVTQSDVSKDKLTSKFSIIDINTLIDSIKTDTKPTDLQQAISYFDTECSRLLHNIQLYLNPIKTNDASRMYTVIHTNIKQTLSNIKKTLHIVFTKYNKLFNISTYILMDELKVYKENLQEIVHLVRKDAELNTILRSKYYNINN